MSPYSNAQRIRQIILQQSKRAAVGHIGSALSVADMIEVLYFDAMRIPVPEDPQRDRFILSKGHASLALYAALHLKGILSAEQLDTYCADQTQLGVHPDHGLRGVDFSTGSLGHGLSIGAGAALAARLQGSDRRAFVLLSDAELNEGSVWEAIMFSGHHRLSNLIALVDVNGQQAFGYTKEVLNNEPLADRFRVFGWEAIEVDGHHRSQMAAALANLDTRSGPPHVLLARTTFGKGVSFMQNSIKWHYWPMSDSEFEQAMAEVGG